MASTQKIKEILSHIDKLPEIPDVALRVNKMLSLSDVDAQALAEIIMLDPILTIQILKICNSAEYGFSRKISTISEAVSILGYTVLKRVITTIISHGCLNRPLLGYALEHGDLWDNAVTCGAYAKHIAIQLGFSDPELACTGALLRDIGKIALENYVQGHVDQIMALAKAEHYPFQEAEEEIVGASHTEIGAHLAAKWFLPEALHHVVSHHHAPSELPENIDIQEKKLVAIIHLADVFTMASGAGIGADGLMYPLDPVVFEILGLSDSTVSLESLYMELLGLNEKIAAMTATLVAN